MKTCETCEHWERNPRGVCARIDEDSEPSEFAPAVMMLSADRSSGALYLVTLPTFGCVLHEERP